MRGLCVPATVPRTPQNASPKLFQTFQDATKTAQEPQEHPRSKFGPFLVPKSDGVPPRASIFEVFSTFKFKFWCQISARELGKFYTTEGSQEVCGILKKLRIPLVDLNIMAWTYYGEF